MKNTQINLRKLIGMQFYLASTIKILYVKQKKSEKFNKNKIFLFIILQ